MKKYDVIVIGTGAAGYSAACRIKEDGRKSVCIVTEGVMCGTSRNTGSDKQTYYKLSLSSSFPDSVRSMAQNLFEGGCVDGDNALCEAALSARCFYNLCELKVPFPCNTFGEYIGYKTDHDPYARATSAGPLTSKFMTEALQKKTESLGVEVFDKRLAIEILKRDNKVCGLICFNIKSKDFEVFACNNIILATGGPAGIYSDSVYPESHSGFTSLALDAGASLQNFTEWQYGLASVSPRWNVSGTYMQVMPRFVSVDKDGKEYEFLAEYFDDLYKALSTVFLKGYQWPFDISKAQNGSSVIDLLVYRETKIKGRKVYLDFTKNPFGFENLEFEKLSNEAYNYLENANALLKTPIERLEKMNSPAIKLYLGKGVDLTNDYLEIALCAQHNNGGVAVDKWWQTEIKGLFAIGECAGTHGVARPGGTALNAGQVGALRASQFICETDNEICDITELAKERLAFHEEFINKALNGTEDVVSALKNVRCEMSAFCGAIRDTEEIRRLIKKREKIFDYKIWDRSQIAALYRLKDTLTVQLALLKAVDDYYEKTGYSRGSALYTDKNGEGEILSFKISKDKVFADKIQHIYEDKILWRNVRPLPEEDNCFETVWSGFRENKNIY